MRVIRRLSLLALLSASFLLHEHPSAADETAELSPSGTPVAVTLDDDVSMRMLKATAPKGAKALHLVAIAPYDVDLYVHGAELDEDEVEEARYVSNSIHMVEHVVVRPNARETFDESAVWYAHVETAWSRSEELDVSVAAFVEWGDPVLVAGEAQRIEVPAGQVSATAMLLVPRGLAAVAVRAEASRGVPSLLGFYETVEVPALRRGHHALVYLAGRPEVTPGVWRFEVGRPKGMPVDAPYTAVLRPSLMPVVPKGDEWDPGEASLLRGANGTKHLTVEQDAMHDFFFDVTPSVYSVRLSAELEGGDIDLYVTPDHEVRTSQSANWGYAGWRDGAEETVQVGGAEPLPVGRYYVRLRHVGGDAGEVGVTWECRARVLAEDERPVSKGALRDTVWRVELGANEPAVWWGLAPPAGPGTWVQVFGSDKDVDLLLMRTDTGATVVRQVSPLLGESLRIPADLVIPDGVGLWVGLCRWNVTHPVVAGELHVSVDGPPKPPTRYFPPYDAFGAGARQRTLAAAVHIATDDGTGSGVVVSPRGLILTCHHVIEDVLPGATIRVSFPTGPRGRPRQLYHAQVVESFDADDLALLELTKDVFGNPVPADREHPFVPLGSSASLALETPLRIVGFGYAGSSSFASNLTVMHGILSGVELEGDREVWLISDARLGSGNSGAGFFDSAGRLVGIHSCSYGDDGSTLNYARPVSAIRASWRERIRREGGTVGVE